MSNSHKIHISGSNVTITSEDGQDIPLQSAEGFKIISDLWLRAGWDNKHVYTFTWMGRPIIQLPEDMVRIQEVIYNLKPTVMVETGIAHGGSLIFYASLFKLMGKGRVIGIDIEIRPHNREAIEKHELFPLFEMIEGSSTAPEVVQAVQDKLKPDDVTMVLLDSNHTYQHVLDELNAYAGMVSVGSYIIATDGIMKQVTGAPRTQPDWITNNPIEAVKEFLKHHDNFVLETPAFAFNESPITEPITYWPSAWLKRIS